MSLLRHDVNKVYIGGEWKSSLLRVGHGVMR
jgi:hypothetical protein